VNTNRRQVKRRRQVFSLVEIMIVVVIIGMIMGLVGPNVMKKLQKAKHQNAKNQIKLLCNAVDDYYLDMSEYPGRLDDLVQNSGHEKWDGPYLTPPKVPLDPWGKEYRYEVPASQGSSPYGLYSYGADNASGGEGESADVHSWE
jgi:general secretion pathway protein G